MPLVQPERVLFATVESGIMVRKKHIAYPPSVVRAHLYLSNAFYPWSTR